MSRFSFFYQRIRPLIRPGRTQEERFQLLREDLNKDIVNRKLNEILSSWRFSGASDELLQHLAFLQTSPYCWENSHQEIWLVYISCLLTRADLDGAKKLLERYHSYYGDSCIDKYPLVSELSCAQKIVNPSIEKAAFIIEAFRKGNESGYFKTLCQGRTVAVVGNGPSEISQNKGAEIDAHDIVIRFNNYVTQGYESDYGTKADIWIKCSNSDIPPVKKNVSLIVYESDYFHHDIFDGALEALFLHAHGPMSCFSLAAHKELRDKYNLHPSTGLICINELLKVAPKKLSVYGFSFLQQNPDGYASHYFNDRTIEEAKARSAIHDYDKETCVIRNLLRDAGALND